MTDAAQSSPAPPRPDGEIRSLTGLRGIAVLLTFVSHAANAGLLPPQFGHGLGQVGVMLFFTLSAWLMTRLYLRRPVTAATTRSYARARIGRVVPLYLLIVLASIGATATGLDWRYDIAGPMPVATHLGFIHARRELWAIPVEIQFYVVFALIWWAHGRGLPLWRALVAAVMGAAALLALQYGLFGRGFGLPLHLPYFMLGMALAAGETAQPPRRPTLPKPVGWALSLALPLAILGLLRNGGIGGLPLWLDPLLMGAIGASFVLARHRLGAFALLETAPARYLGTVSYGFYLIHPLVLHSWPKSGPAALTLIGVFVLTLALAHLSWHLFEAPLLRRIKRGPAARPDTRALPPGHRA